MGCLTGPREWQGHLGTGEGRREIRQRGLHMVGFAINFECFCGSITFPRVVYKEEIGGKNRVMGSFQTPT